MLGNKDEPQIMPTPVEESAYSAGEEQPADARPALTWGHPVIRAVVFDFGGVLVRTSDYSGRRKWEQRLGLGEWGADKVVFGSEIARRAELGQATDDELWAWVRERLGLTGEELHAFRRDFWGGDALDRELVDLLMRLRPRYRLGLLSNASAALRPALGSHYAPLAECFDVIMISCEEGLRKPDPQLYMRLLERLGVPPDEAVFIDDMEANAAGARAVGMHGIRFTSTPELITALEGLGVRAGRAGLETA